MRRWISSVVCLLYAELDTGCQAARYPRTKLATHLQLPLNIEEMMVVPGYRQAWY